MNQTLDPKQQAGTDLQNPSADLFCRMDQELEDTIRFYRVQPDFVVERRIQALRAEWSTERYLQMNVATVAGLSAMAALRNRSCGLFACGALAFFLAHALRGLDAPVLLLRRLGIRTRTEIDREMYALKAMRGDFEHVPVEHVQEADSSIPVQEVIRAVKA